MLDSKDFEKYTKPDPGAFWRGKRRPAVYDDPKYSGELTARQKKAMDEKDEPVVGCDKIIELTNEILKAGGFNPVVTPILKGDLLTEILDHSFDDKYYERKLKPYGLSSASQLIWMRFANDGHLGVVAASNDINFDHDTRSYRIIEPCKLDWDKSFVLIFPLSANINYNRDEVETAVGNYLIENKVPILDYYSHNYHQDKKQEA